jgi:hypothetical protein
MPRASAFQKTLRSNRNVTDRTVSVTFLGDDSKEYEIAVAVKCVPVAISALANEYGRILSALPAEPRLPLQPIQGTGIVPAIGTDGMFALILQLKGGGELTIEFSKAAMTEASARLTELMAAIGKGQFR